MQRVNVYIPQVQSLPFPFFNIVLTTHLSVSHVLPPLCRVCLALVHRPVSDNVVETRLVFPLPQKHRQKVKQERWLNIPKYWLLQVYYTGVYTLYCECLLETCSVLFLIFKWRKTGHLCWSQCNIWASCSTIFSFGLVIKRASYLRGNTFQTSQSFLLLFFFISPGISKAKVSFCRSDPGFEQRASLSVINVPQVIYKD